jgi:hypothetical protein
VPRLHLLIFKEQASHLSKQGFLRIDSSADLSVPCMSALVYYLKCVFYSHVAEIAIFVALLPSDNGPNPPFPRLSEK